METSSLLKENMWNILNDKKMKAVPLELWQNDTDFLAMCIDFFATSNKS